MTNDYERQVNVTLLKNQLAMAAREAGDFNKSPQL